MRYPTTTEVFGAGITTGEFPFTGEFIDFTIPFEVGTKISPDVKVIPLPVNGRWTGEWRWLNFRGKWGSRGWPDWLRRVPLLGGTWKAPGSLPERSNWTNPFVWADPECREAPPLDIWLERQ